MRRRGDEKFRGSRTGRFIGKGNAENRPNFEAVESAGGCSRNVCGDRKLWKPYQVDVVRFPAGPGFVSLHRKERHKNVGQKRVWNI